MTANPATTSTIEQVMDTLNSQWYNAITKNCGLDPNSFQLVQANQPLAYTSESLWNVFDAVPPLSITHYFNPAQLNVFSSDYGGVINNLKAQNANKFVSDMGDFNAQWEAYKKTNPTIPNPGGILQLFYNWSQLNMPPDQAQQCYTDYQQVAQGIVPVAVQMWLNAGGSIGGVKAYNATIQQLKTLLPSAPGKSFQLDTSTESSDVSHTWANGNIQGAYDFFWGGASADYDQLTTMLASSGITMDVTFKRLLSFAAGPLAKTSSDPILSQYQPWYDSAALNLAYQHNDNLVWNNTPPSWEDTFGANGNMQRMCSALVVVDGMTITTTSSATFSSSQQTMFKTAASGGFWPFFSASGSGGWSHDISFDTAGSVTITSTCPEGNPNVLGVLVTPIKTALGTQLGFI